MAILVFIFGFASLSYGAYGIVQHVVTPFQFTTFDSQDILKEIIPKSEEADLAAAKLKDTDADTLSDYDEVNIYATSPYLFDSDSDGKSDGAEVKSGSDPNCKQGEDCRGIRLVTPETKISDLFPQFSTSQITLRDKTVQDFRQILQDQGYDKENLDKISDGTLLIILEESLKVQDQELSTTTDSGISPVTEEEYDNLRLLLIEMGVPQDEVYSMSNKDIEDILKTFK